MSTAGEPLPECDHCGLPLPRPLFGKAAPPRTDDSPRYCCFGCRIAADIAREQSVEGAPRALLTRLAIGLFFAMNVMVFTLVLWSFDIYETEGAPPAAGLLHESLRWLCLLATGPVLLLLGQPLLLNAVRDLKERVLSSDLLLLTGVLAAFGYSVTSLLTGRGSVYFETVCMILVFVTLGRWFEATGRQRATNVLDGLQRLLPETARRISGSSLAEIPLDQVATGDRLSVHAGERFPADGRLASPAAVDEQLFTGESCPVEKVVGEIVLAGSVNLQAMVTIEVTDPPRSGALSRMLDAVRTARASRGRYHRLADRVAAGFFPVIVLVALATYGGHLLAGNSEQALLAALAVVLVACPCALGIATPLAVWSALSRAAEMQVLFRSGESIERLAGIRCLFFDKTGTLTTGIPRVRVCASVDGIDEDEVLARAAALAATSRHPHSRAIVQYSERLTTPLRPDSIAAMPGHGLAGRFESDSDDTVLGSPSLMQQRGYACNEDIQSLTRRALADGHPVTQIGWNGRVHGTFVIEEDLRPEARIALVRCSELGLPVQILTGDHAARGAQVAEALKVPVQVELRPEDKEQAVREARGHNGPVAMVGDGLNDAAALTGADVGIAMGCGADITRDAAEVCLLSDNLEQIPAAIELSRRTVRTIRQNLAWAFSYNGVGVVIAAGGWLHPAVAAGLMLASSLLVIANSLRLRRYDAMEDRPTDTSTGQLGVADTSIVGLPERGLQMGTLPGGQS